MPINYFRHPYLKSIDYDLVLLVVFLSGVNIVVVIRVVCNILISYICCILLLLSLQILNFKLLGHVNAVSSVSDNSCMLFNI